MGVRSAHSAIWPVLGGWSDHHRAVALDEIHEFLMFFLGGAEVAQGSGDLERHHVEVVLAHIKVRVRVPHVAPGVTLRPSGVLDRPGRDQELEPSLPLLLVELRHGRVHVGGRVGIEPVHKDVHCGRDAIDAAQPLVKTLFGHLISPSTCGWRPAVLRIDRQGPAHLPLAGSGVVSDRARAEDPAMVRRPAVGSGLSWTGIRRRQGGWSAMRRLVLFAAVVAAFVASSMGVAHAKPALEPMYANDTTVYMSAPNAVAAGGINTSQDFYLIAYPIVPPAFTRSATSAARARPT